MMTTAVQLIEPDPTPIREKYTAEYQRTSSGGWPVGNVSVYRHEGEAKHLLYQYERRYSMMNTFEPFRQLQGDRWHDYALISPEYTSFQVLDLETATVVAKLPPPEQVIPEEWLTEHPDWFGKDQFLEGKKPGDTRRIEGFCPVDFWVPDFATQWVGDHDQWDSDIENHWFVRTYEHHLGRFAFYSGCIWGDDTSMKLRYIDLSRISEGIVSDDERFGYWELPELPEGKGRLSEIIYYSGDSSYVGLPLQVPVNLATGKASKYVRDSVNWDEEPV